MPLMQGRVDDEDSRSDWERADAMYEEAVRAERQRDAAAKRRVAEAASELPARPQTDGGQDQPSGSNTQSEGWYQDPDRPKVTRYWDGKNWTKFKYASLKGIGNDGQDQPSGSNTMSLGDWALLLFILVFFAIMVWAAIWGWNHPADFAGNDEFFGPEHHSLGERIGSAVGLGIFLPLVFLVAIIWLASLFFEDDSTTSKIGSGPNRERVPERVRNQVWRRDQGRCASCGSRVKLEIDHIVPVSKGGSNTARNLELLCERCNREKGARI
jgi:hypothetical protein